MAAKKLGIRRRITIRDLAEKAGLSVASVSMALNDYPKLKTETKERVLHLAAEMGYTPNVSARALSRRRTNLIGVLIQSIKDTFFPEILQGIEDVFFETEFSPIICITRDDPEKERTYFTRLVDKQVDGIIYLPPPFGQIFDELHRVQSLGIPMVSVLRRQTEVDIPYVVVDNKYGSYLATRYLLELGHRRIGHLTPATVPTTSFFPQSRRAGYQQALAEWGIAYNPDWIEEYENFTWDDGMRAMRRLLSHAEHLTAVFASSDIVAIGASYTARNLGLSIPSDISLVGFDGIEIGAIAEVPLTTVSQPRYDIGACAAEKLLALIKGQTVESEILQPQLVVRASTCPPREKQ